MKSLAYYHAAYMTFDVNRIRYPLAAAVIVFSILDLWLTQTILSGTSGHAEANLLMALIVMSWLAWPVRVGVPALIVWRDLRKGSHDLLLKGAFLYGMVVAWNFAMYMGVDL